MIRRTACLISGSDDPVYNQAIELHLMDALPESTAMLVLSRSRPAVVQGAKQDTEEICRRQMLVDDGGMLCRRVSGGEACYLDPGVLNYALIVPRSDFHGGRQLSLLINVLQSVGVPCALIRGADFGLNGRPFCTGSFYINGSSTLHHGSLFTDCDFSRAALYLTDRGLTPFANLTQINPNLTVQALEEALFEQFGLMYGCEPIWMSENMLNAHSVAEWEKRLRDENWIRQTGENSTLRVSERFPWGSVTVCLRQESGIIRYARVFSDALECTLLETAERFLIGCPFLIGAIDSRFSQKLSGLSDPRLLQIARDLCTLICGHIRQNDRRGQM